jgi:hypothetical protein
MKINKVLMVCIAAVFTVSIAFTSCQKLDRPELGELILDPPPPPYDPLKDFWEFEGNVGDSGQSKLPTESKGISYAAGASGQAVKMDAPDSWVMVKQAGDTIKNLGSFTIAYWMNGPSPVGTAQGVFGIGNSKAFWGNVEMYLETWNNGSEAYLKINVNNNGAELFSEIKVPNLLDKWSHLALVYDGTTSKLTLYVDGQPHPDINGKTWGAGGKIKFNDLTGIAIGNFTFETTPTLGSHGGEPWGEAFHGLLDQVRIYNEPLTASQIQQLVTDKK